MSGDADARPGKVGQPGGVLQEKEREKGPCATRRPGTRLANHADCERGFTRRPAHCRGPFVGRWSASITTPMRRPAKSTFVITPVIRRVDFYTGPDWQFHFPAVRVTIRIVAG
jgi:hypothetical protein